MHAAARWRWPAGWRDAVPAVLLAAGYGLLLLAWVFGNAPFASPDEEAHYVRTIGIASTGALVGRPAAHEPTGELDPRRDAWVAQAVRAVRVPAGLDPAGFSCYGRDPTSSARCLDGVARNPQPVERVSSVGTYQPAGYLAPAAVVRLGDTPVGVLYLARLASTGVAWTLVALACALAWRPDAGVAAVVGLVTAVTPMVVFVAASLNPSGFEIAAGIALAAAVLRLARPDQPPGWAWAAVAVAAAALALSRSSGAAWVGVYAALAVVWWGPARALRLLRSRAGVATVAVVGVAVALARVWELRYGPEVALGFQQPVLEALAGSWARFTDQFNQVVGVFGYLQVLPPTAVHRIWYAALWILFLAALAVGTNRQRVQLVATVAIVVAASVLLDAYVLVNTGFRLQARHVLAILVAVPLASGHVLAARAARVRAWHLHWVLAAVVAAALGAHLWAWHYTARSAAVGPGGPAAFWREPLWTPWLGWAPWLGAVLLGAGALAAGAVVAARLPQHQGRATADIVPVDAERS